MAGEWLPTNVFFVLDDAQFDAFAEVLESPPAPDPKLRALLSVARSGSIPRRLAQLIPASLWQRRRV